MQRGTEVRIFASEPRTGALNLRHVRCLPFLDLLEVLVGGPDVVPDLRSTDHAMGHRRSVRRGSLAAKSLVGPLLC
jgi:hypothetical protein